MKKIKIRIKSYPIVCVSCHKCKRFDYILGVGCKNCDLEIIKKVKAPHNQNGKRI